MGDADVRAAVSHVLSVLREAGRAEGTVRRHQIVLDWTVPGLVDSRINCPN